VVAAIMARELDRDKKWEDQQVREYSEMAAAYILF